jgi:hypothetical protein
VVVDVVAVAVAGRIETVLVLAQELKIEAAKTNSTMNHP